MKHKFAPLSGSMTHVYLNEAAEVGDVGEGAAPQADAPAEEAAQESVDEAESEAPKTTEAEAKLLAEVMKRKADNKALAEKYEGLTKTQAELQAQLDAFASLGVSAEEVSQILADRAKKEEEILEGEKNWEALKKRMGQEHQKALDSRTDQMQQEIDKLAERLEAAQDNIREMTVGVQFANSKFIREGTTLNTRVARNVYDSYFDVDAKGQVVGYDAPRGAEGRTPLVDANGNNLPFDEAMKAIVNAEPDKDEILKADVRPGAASASHSDVEERSAPKESPRGLGRIQSALGVANS